MDRVQLEVITIGEGISSANSAFNVLLKEKYGTRKMVIVISYLEAQSIVMSLNNTILSTRLMTHDFFYKVCKTYNIEMLEVNIHSLKEGIFKATSTFKKNDMEETFEARISDSLAMSLKYNCPIYINSKLLDSVAFGKENETEKEIEYKDDEIADLEKEIDKINIEEISKKISKFKKNTIGELKEMLEAALLEENYELAAKLRDEIDNRS